MGEAQCDQCGGTGWYLTPPLECRDGKMRRTRCKCGCGKAGLTDLARENADLRARLASGDKCHPFVCNPTCPLCGDTPSCGDGSWRWNGKRQEHRCRDAHPQSGHDEVLCEKHQPGALIAMLRDEVKALRNARDAKIAELDRAEKARDEQAEAVRVLAEGAYVMWTSNNFVRIANAHTLILSNPIAAAAVKEAGQ